jgi:lysophospholipase L1-like esterase
MSPAGRRPAGLARSSSLTGNGNAGSPTGTGNADVLTSADGVHPTQAGHDELGRQLFERLRAQLQP